MGGKADNHLPPCAALPHVTSAFATVSDSIPRTGLLVCSARPGLPFLPLVKQQKAMFVPKTEAECR